MKDNSLEFFIQGETLEEIVSIQEQKVKSAVWLQMEFFSWAMRIDEPSEVMDLILESMEEYYFDFPTINEYFERRKHNKIEGEVEEMIDDFNQKLKFAVQEHMGFLSGFLEITEFETVMMMIDLLVYKAILEYVPRMEDQY